jgi:hypothetical protein
MKVVSHVLMWCGAVSLTSCSDFNGPLGGGSFDPLNTAGYQQQRDDAGMGGNYQFKAGQFVTAASNSTAFFNRKPTGNADADSLLSAGTTMRVIKTEGSFVKVELDNGSVGYVAAALLLEGQSAGAAGIVPPMSTEAVAPLPDGLQPGVAPTDLGTGAPLPPIAPPTVNELPPSSLDKKPSGEVPLPPPAGSDTIPKPPIGQ